MDHPSLDCLDRVLKISYLMQHQKGALVVRCLNFISNDQLEELHEKFIQQISSGVVLLPSFCTAEYVPKDVLVKMEGYHGPVR